VTFRYTKSETDKVRREAPVAWGTIVEGIDEGDGWLKVDRYYLPMTFQGLSLLVPVVDEKATTSIAVEPIEQPVQPVPTAALARAMAVKVPCAAVQGLPAQSTSLCVDRRRRPPTPATAAEARIAEEEEEAGAELSASSSGPPLAAPAEEAAEAESAQEPKEDAREDTSEDQDKKTEESVKEHKAELPWQLKPSVGTWLLKAQRPACTRLAAPAATTPATEVAGEEEEEEEQAPVQPENDTACEPQLFADVLLRKLGKPIEDVHGSEDISPSTCAPEGESPLATPLSAGPLLAAVH